jgi:hypothetical protein
MLDSNRYAKCGNPLCCKTFYIRSPSRPKKFCSYDCAIQRHVKNDLCLNCNNLLLFNKDKRKKFCNQSCAAIYNNKNRDASSRIKQQQTIKRRFPSKEKKHAKNNPKCLIHPTTTIPNIINSIEKLNYMYNNLNMTSTEILQKLNIKYTNFTVFLKSLGIKTKPRLHPIRGNKEHFKNFSIYRNRSSFKKIKEQEISKIINYKCFLDCGVFHSTINPNGVVKDHMVSVKYGFDNNIDPNIIRHPANCAFISQHENSKKNSKNSISLEILLERTKTWNK